MDGAVVTPPGSNSPLLLLRSTLSWGITSDPAISWLAHLLFPPPTSQHPPALWCLKLILSAFQVLMRPTPKSARPARRPSSGAITSHRGYVISQGPTLENPCLSLMGGLGQPFPSLGLSFPQLHNDGVAPSNSQISHGPMLLQIIQLDILTFPFSEGLG